MGTVPLFRSGRGIVDALNKLVTGFSRLRFDRTRAVARPYERRADAGILRLYLRRYLAYASAGSAAAWAHQSRVYKDKSINVPGRVCHRSIARSCN